MVTIRFADSSLEDGLRIIMNSGTVVYTDRMDTYKIPGHITGILDREGVKYQVVKANHRSGSTISAASAAALPPNEIE